MGDHRTYYKAHELARFCMLINDLIDVASYYLRDINPKNGVSPCTLTGATTETAEEMTAMSPGDGETLEVADASLLPTGSFIIRVDIEQIGIASRSGNILTLALSGARGYSGTTPSVHGVGARVVHTSGEEVVSTVAWLKQQANQCYQNCVVNNSMLQTYIDNDDPQVLIDSLASIGISATAQQAELTNMKNCILYVKSQIGSATTKAELAVLGQYLVDNVEKSGLVRRPWAMVT